MKPVRLISTGVLLLLLGAVTPTYARREQRQQDENTPKREQQAKPEKQQQQQEQGKQQQQRAQQQVNRPSQQVRPVQQAERGAWQERRAQNWQSEHQTWQQRGGYNADRIPEDRYRSNFGPDHAFRIYSNPVVVTGGYPGFQYGGFYFSVVDRWPEYWSNNWYENDDVYIDYSGDGIAGAAQLDGGRSRFK